MDILAVNLAAIWADYVWPIFLLIVGLGLVIFVHELGHFLVAKMVKIKVERFALGFGPRLVGLKVGETDYCINLLPLGGYVKMLGQEDFKPQDGQVPDPRAYTSKSVGARFAVISAGVIMNVIFAAVLFIIVGMVGIRFIAPVIGDLMPDHPAAEAHVVWENAPPETAPAPAAAQTTQPRAATTPASGPASTPASVPASAPALAPAPRTDGLRPGDLIVAIDGKPLHRFEQLFVTAALADPDDKFHLTIEREVDGRTLVGTADVGVAKTVGPAGDTILAFGIARPLDTVLGKPKDPGTGEDYVTNDAFEEGDDVVAINGQPVRHYWDITPIERRLDGQPVTVTVKRDGKNVDVKVQPNLGTIRPDSHQDQFVIFLKDGTRVRGDLVVDKTTDTAYGLRVNGQEKVYSKDQVASLGSDEFLDILGMIPRLKVAGVLAGSPAEKAGLQPGDIVIGYGDHDVPTFHQFLQINESAKGTGTHIRVIRDGKTIEPIWIVPRERQGRPLVGLLQSVDMSHLVLSGVREGSPAAKAKLTSGTLIEKVNGTAVTTWADLRDALDKLRGQKIALTCRDGSREFTADLGELTDQVFDPGDYRVRVIVARDFLPLMGPVVKKGPGEAVVWGVNETWDFILRTYATLRSLSKRTISHKEVIGPIGMGSVAIQVGRESFIKLVYFMAMISVSLAVINFLPIPVVDGGHAVFLLIEKIRGKPVPTKIMNAVQMLGLALLLFVFVAVCWQDISRLVGTMWH